MVATRYDLGLGGVGLVKFEGEVDRVRNETGVDRAMRVTQRVDDRDLDGLVLEGNAWTRCMHVGKVVSARRRRTPREEGLEVSLVGLHVDEREGREERRADVKRKHGKTRLQTSRDKYKGETPEKRRSEMMSLYNEMCVRREIRIGLMKMEISE